MYWGFSGGSMPGAGRAAIDARHHAEKRTTLSATLVRVVNINVSGQPTALLPTERVRYSEACASAEGTAKVVMAGRVVAAVLGRRAHRVRPFVVGAVSAMHSTRLSAASVIIFPTSVLTA